MNENDLTFQEAYGTMPKALWKIIRKYNVSPSDYMMIEFTTGEDYDQIAGFITDNLRNGSFLYPMGGMVR